MFKLIDPNDTNIDNIYNIDKIIDQQINKLNELRKEVKKLQFIPIDKAGNYQSVTYKAIDGGKMKISFDPLEMDLIEVADSNGNLKMRFILPKASDESNLDDYNSLDDDFIIKKFLNIFGKNHLSEISEILNQSDSFMELSEWACLFEKIMEHRDDPLIVMRDGLLRTKKIKAELIPYLIEVLKKKRDLVKLVGVAKTSKVINLLSTSIAIEKIFPEHSIGFIKIPKDLEAKAYAWTGKGKRSDTNNKLVFAFGDLYIAKISRDSNLLLTVEIPRDIKNDENVYSEDDIIKIMGHLAKDSEYSYPVLGYPQTIMRAHEAAVRIGFPATIIRDKIMDKLRESMDDNAKEFMINADILKEFVDKGVLGGGYNY